MATLLCCSQGVVEPYPSYMYDLSLVPWRNHNPYHHPAGEPCLVVLGFIDVRRRALQGITLASSISAHLRVLYLAEQWKNLMHREKMTGMTKRTQDSSCRGGTRCRLRVGSSRPFLLNPLESVSPTLTSLLSLTKGLCIVLRFRGTLETENY